MLGKNPKKVKLSLANPEADKAVIKALGPGIGVTSISSFFACFTKKYPGSLIRGVPASLIRAIDFPECISSIITLVFSLSLCS